MHVERGAQYGREPPAKSRGRAASHDAGNMSACTFSAAAKSVFHIFHFSHPGRTVKNSLVGGVHKN